MVTVRTGDLYGLVRTDLTGKLSKHIYAPDLGPKLPSYVISDLGPEHKCAPIAYQSNPFSLSQRERERERERETHTHTHTHTHVQSRKSEE